MLQTVKTLAVGNWVLGGAVELWDSTTGEPLAILKEGIGRVKGLEFSSDGAMLACASWHREVEYHMWEVATRREVISFVGEQDGLYNGLALSQTHILLRVQVEKRSFYGMFRRRDFDGP